MPGTRKGYTTQHQCAAVGDHKRNIPSQSDILARHRLQDKERHLQQICS